MPYDYDRRAAKKPKSEGLTPSSSLSEGAQWVVYEVLNDKENGKYLYEHFVEYLHDFIKRSQELHELLMKRYKEAAGSVDGGDKISQKDLVDALFREVVYQNFGDDPLAKLLARALATGDYIY